VASIQVTLTANTVLNIPLDVPTGRIVVTQAAGTAAEVYATVYSDDQALPVFPTQGVELSSIAQQRTLSALLGSQIVLQPRLYGDHMVVPSISLLSSGTPTVLVEW
jgi:hypothetical protein